VPEMPRLSLPDFGSTAVLGHRDRLRDTSARRCRCATSCAPVVGRPSGRSTHDVAAEARARRHGVTRGFHYPKAVSRIARCSSKSGSRRIERRPVGCRRVSWSAGKPTARSELW